MCLEVLRQVDAEIRERQVGDGDPGGKVFQIDDRILKLEELLAPVFQIVHLVAGLLLDQVLLARGGNIQQHHATADPLFQVDVLVQLHIRPEVDELDALVGRADTVNAAEALDDAHRIPMDVVVDQPVAVLKVLTLGDAVGGNEQIDFPFARQIFRALFGARRESSEDGGQILAQPRQRGLVAPAPVTRAVSMPKRFLRPRASCS